MRVLQDLQSERSCDRVLASCFPEQLNFITDPSEFKAALTTRRAGKTTACTIYLIYEALKNPGCNCLYIGLTRGTAKSLMLTGGDDGAFLKKYLDLYKIKAEVNLSEMHVRLSNGSVIWLTGTDATPEQSKKLYGNKYQLVVIDEAGSHRQDLADLIYMKLRPAMAQGDHSGTIALIGTPENNRRFFYRVTSNDPENDDQPQGWSVHRWTYTANKYEREAIEKQIQKLRENFPGISTNPKHEFYPMFRQHYMSEWIIDAHALVYAFNSQTNIIDELPPGEFTYCAGVDFGFVDAATVVVVAYRPHDPTLYVVESFKQSYLDKTEFAVEIVRRKEKYGIKRLIADHDPATIQDIHNRFDVYLEAAEKHDKVGFISMMNADWLRGRVKIVRSQDTAPLIDELQKLVWDKRELVKGLKREDPTVENHCTDALLYVWRSLYHYLARPQEKNDNDPYAQYALFLKKRTQQKIKEKLERNHVPIWRRHHTT